jgi:formylglycine-generating enzyme required for sulfatase activity
MLLLVVALVAGCKDSKPHVKCTDDTQCTLAGRPGVCVDSSCATHDTTCPSGLRFDTSAGGTGECVAPIMTPDMAMATATPDMATKPECMTDSDCTNGGTAPCGGTCVQNKCAYAGPIVDCGSTCTAGMETHKVCDGHGACAVSTLDCGAYTCGTQHCKDSCTTATTDCNNAPCTNNQCVSCPADMIWVPASTFSMGEPDNGQHNTAIVTATVSKGFCIDKHEVTVAQYKACVTAGACPAEPVAWVTCSYNVANSDNVAMNCTNWAMAQQYCAWAGLPGGARRLPWEVEWELAARGTDGRTYPWGNTALACNLANYWDSTKNTYCNPAALHVDAVGSLSPAGDSPFGLQDAAGNVMEWTEDCGVTNYTGGGVCNQTCTDPRAPGDPMTCSTHTVRGGAASSNQASQPTYYRLASAGSSQFGDFVEYGIRCAK